jgi:hypothetical protein
MTTEAEKTLIEAALAWQDGYLFARGCGTTAFRLAEDLEPALEKACQEVRRERIPEVWSNYTVTTEPAPPYKGASGLSFDLLINLDYYIDSKKEWNWDPKEVEMFHRLCRSFCKHLLDFSSPDESLVYVPDTDPDLLKKVVYGRMVSPVSRYTDSEGKTHFLEAQARKCKIRFCLEDVAEEDPIDQAGKEAALDVKIEIRHNAKDGRPVKAYMIYLPPYLTPVFLEPKGDWSIDRRFMIRYAKVY